MGKPFPPRFDCIMLDTTFFFRNAANFTISRRRMVVPIHKRWEANFVRLQITKKENTVRLVVFFKEFDHGSCMNFTLKITDVFESFSRSGLFLIRVVDAKFALPRNGDDINKDFVSLDMPEFPSEHDDIDIGFDSQSGMAISAK